MKMMTRALLGTTLMLATTLCTTQALWAQAEIPGKDQVELIDVVSNGSGCAVGESPKIEAYSSTEEGAIDRIHVTFPNFIADTTERARRFCNMSFDLKYPEGWSYSLEKGAVRGYAEVQKGAKAILKMESTIGRNHGQKSTKKRVQEGYWEGDYTFTDRFGLVHWSRCGKVELLNIKLTAMISGNKEANSIVTIDGTTKGSEDFHIKWRRC